MLRFQMLEVEDETDANERLEREVETSRDCMAGCCRGEGAGRTMSLGAAAEVLREGLLAVRLLCWSDFPKRTYWADG